MSETIEGGDGGERKPVQSGKQTPERDSDQKAFLMTRKGDVDRTQGGGLQINRGEGIPSFHVRTTQDYTVQTGLPGISLEERLIKEARR